MLRDPSLVPLSRDHHHALALCVRIGRALQSKPTTLEFPASALDVTTTFDREIGHHFNLEETILFPAIATIPELCEVVGELWCEHRQLRTLVDSLRSAPSRSTLREFAAVLEDHIRKEERIFFEEIQRLLTAADLATIGQAIAAAHQHG